MNTPAVDPIAFRLFNEIGIIEHLSRTEFERVLPEGLSAASFTVLNHFVRLNRSAASPSQLASAFQVTKGAMTNTLQRLEALGYVRLESNAADGRGKIVSITAPGRAAREEAIQRLAPMLARLLSEISEAELAAILPTLAKLRAILDAARA
jgi:DNA-binding MarR family transcriptional regulator